MARPEQTRESVHRRRWLVLGGLAAAVVVLRLLSSCTAGPPQADATPERPTQAAWTTCSPHLPGLTSSNLPL